MGFVECLTLELRIWNLKFEVFQFVYIDVAYSPAVGGRELSSWFETLFSKLSNLWNVKK